MGTGDGRITMITYMYVHLPHMLPDNVPVQYLLFDNPCIILLIPLPNPGVAQAFGEGVYPHPDLVALCKQFFGTDDLKSPKLKLAFVSKYWYICARQ